MRTTRKRVESAFIAGVLMASVASADALEYQAGRTTLGYVCVAEEDKYDMITDVLGGPVERKFVGAVEGAPIEFETWEHADGNWIITLDVFNPETDAGLTCLLFGTKAPILGDEV